MSNSLFTAFAAITVLSSAVGFVFWKKHIIG
ncbi:MAG: hypothetical protein H7289_01095 [Mucilaginibacter sp.]|nr:hypothetical protein [Mucilaginibacter sp.]